MYSRISKYIIHIYGILKNNSSNYITVVHLHVVVHHAQYTRTRSHKI